MKRTKALFRGLSFIMMLCLLLQMIPMEAFAVAPDADQIQSAPFPVNYDPNDGMIHYGHSGEVGFRPENDTNNIYEADDKVIYFPDDVINERDENGNPLFPDYNPGNAYYDYTDMFNRAMAKSKEQGNAEIFVNPGVFYFTGSVYLNSGTSINAEAGKTAFVIKPNYQDKDGNPVDVTGFFTNPNLNETYAWYQGGIGDLIFVVEGTHDAFKPTSSVQTIMDNLCSDQVNAVKDFSLFYRIRMKYSGIDNIALSGFHAFMRWTFTDMLTRVTSVTVGPTRLVYHGVQTNDAFFYDCYYYGGYFTEDDLHEIPVFQINFSMGTTVFANSYLGNYYFSRSGAGCWCPHTTYSNLTLERVCNFVIDTTTVSSSVSGCLFKDGAYNDIKKYFESQGLTPYDHATRYYDHTAKKWVYPGTGYVIRDNIVGDNAYDRKHSANHWDGQMLTMIQLHSGIAFTQNKIQCDSLDWTTLVRLTDSEWSSRYDARRNATNLQFSDNAFEIREWDYGNLMVDDWRGGKPYTEGWHDNTIIVWGERGWKNDDGTPAMGWVGAEGPEPVCWLKDGVYVSTELEKYIDLSAFLDKNKPTAGYAALGAVGADEQGLWDAGLEDQYYKDLHSGNYEILSFVDDFGGFNWNTSSNHEKLQEAFDYVATHDDAILYIESGTYRTDKPIVLRGGATYRVVFNGEIRANKTTDMDGAGIFVMSGDDNEPIKGYFIEANLYMQDTNSSGFYNVNFDDFYMKVHSIARGVGAFTNCKLTDTILHEGQIQYNDYGFFYKTVTNNTLVKNVYGTSSTGVEGADGYTPGDINYKYFISSSDFTKSTWRGCWLEFGQFSNGKTLTGAGNSVYRGNIIDYTYNYSFGKNDVVCGNTMTRANYGSIVNHMENSNFPIDKPDVLKDKPMIMFHVSDGLRLIGNTDLGAMNPQTHFIEFDSPGISYKDANGNIVKSISNVRIAGNVVYTITGGEYKQNIPVMPFDKADNVVFENCKNNQILLHHWYLRDQVDDPETEEAEIPYTITKDEVISWSIPGVKTYVNKEYLEVKEPTTPAKNLEQVVTPQPAQDEIFDVPNKWEGEGAYTEYELFDFKNRTPEEAQALAEKMAGYIDNSTIVAYRNSGYNKVVVDGEEMPLAYYDGSDVKGIKNLSPEERRAILQQIVQYAVKESPSGNNAFLMDGSRAKTDDTGGGNDNVENKPTYAIIFRDEELSGNSLQSVNTSFYYDFELSYAWLGKRPLFIILSEDAEKYYGILLGYTSGDYGIYTAVSSYEKDFFNRYVDEQYKFADYGQTGLSNVKNDISRLSHIDTFSGITRPAHGEQGRTVFGDYTEIPMFEGNVYNYDSVVLGVDLTCEYNDDYGSVSVYATFDFSNIGKDESQTPALQASTRKVWIGTFPIQGNNKIFGLWNGDKTWLESVQFEYVPETPATCDHVYTDEITRETTCTKDGVVRHTCTKCGYDYEEPDKALGHVFWDKVLSDGRTQRTCTVCELSFITTEEPKYECSHRYTKTIITEETCTTDGIINYICSICEDSYTETVPAPGHEYTSTVVPPTVEAEGYTEYFCTECGDTYKGDYVPKVEVQPTPTPTAAPTATPTPDAGRNMIEGIVAGGIYYVGDTISFTAIGDGMNITATNQVFRYAPVSWKVNPSGTWESAPYTASFTISTAGDYTLKVTFAEQEYENGTWNNTGRTSETSVDFVVKERQTEPTATPTAEPTAEPTTAPTQAPTAAPTSAPTAAPVVTAVPESTTIPTYPIDKSPQTGREDMMLVLCGCIMCLMSGLALVMSNKKKKK